uniref:Uncharacterized protein n=1 Tax=Arundo donax TaxID=35708 RepID=A0A0A9A7B5_ARUDO
MLFTYSLICVGYSQNVYM